MYKSFISTGKVELVFLDLPLDMHSNAFKAAQAAACAGEQDQFWDMHHYLFANQDALEPDKLPQYAEDLQLDVDAFRECLANGRHDGEIRQDVRTAHRLRIEGTPAYLIGRRIPKNGKLRVLEVIKGLPPYEVLAEKLNGFLDDT